MGAITGVIADDGNPLDPTLAERLIAAAPVRGFDGISVWQDGPACLIRHHHATTPQAVGETQPLVSQDGRLVAMLDGRIDNRPDVIATLARADCRDETPDVALVLALFERFGEECVTRLVGDWALAVWNTTDRSLFLARSPLGWRPLIWSHAGGRFGFATDARTLLRGLGLDHAPNLGRMGEMLALRSVSQTETLWSAICEVEQGGAMRVSHGTVRQWRWHSIPQEIDETLSDSDHIDRFVTLFDQAVIAANRSNTIVSAQLSGGLDSSSVVARAIELHRAGRIARPVQAISARFPGMEQDETRWSSAVEAHLGITARITSAAPHSFTAAHHWSAATYQLPVRPNVFETSVAAFRLMAADGGRVLLTGEGGDDWMGGGVETLVSLFRQRRFGTVVREGLTQYPGEPLWRRLGRIAYWSVMPTISARQRSLLELSYLGPLKPLTPDWVRPEWNKAIGLEDRILAAAPQNSCSDIIQRTRYTNYSLARRTINYGNVIALADQLGVEIRHPFHDLRLTHYFMTAAPRMIKRHGIRKIVLREAMRGSLPEIVRLRLDKTKFNKSSVDAIAERLKTRPIDTLLPVTLGWLDPNVLRAMAREQQGSNRKAGRLYNTGPLWFALSLDIWLQEATGGWAGH